MGLVAQRLSEVLGQEGPDSIANLAGIGASGSKFTSLINPEAPSIKVITLKFDVDRWLRRLIVKPITSLPEEPVICDDALISGATICAVVARLGLNPRIVAAGLSYNSKRSRRRVGFPILEALRYSRLGGGCPPMNSISTLVSEAGQNVLDNLSNKYFDGRAEELKAILERI